MKRIIVTLMLLTATLGLGGCGYNTMQAGDQQIKAAWAEVVNQYQRRADLVPNLVNTVKGFAQQEKDVLLGVTNARSKVGSIQATPELVNDPGAFKKFQAAQGELSSALSRLLVVTENYPQLKSDQNFRDLQAQLEGTENRITVARNRYIKSVQEYNTTVVQFPSNLTAMMFGFKEKAQFTVENEKEISTRAESRFRQCAGAGARESRHSAEPAERVQQVIVMQQGSLRRAWPRALLLLGVALIAATSAFADVAIPPLKSRVTDLTATLSSQQQATLEQTLAAFETRKGSQIAVLIVPTTQPETVEQYAVRVEENWKLGRKGVDDGVLLLIAKDDRKLRIEVGYGLEGVLNDATAKRIIAEDITPRFKQGDFYGGISAGVERMIKVIDGEPLPPPKARPQRAAALISIRCWSSVLSWSSSSAASCARSSAALSAPASSAGSPGSSRGRSAARC